MEQQIRLQKKPGRTSPVASSAGIGSPAEQAVAVQTPSARIQAGLGGVSLTMLGVSTWFGLATSTSWWLTVTVGALGAGIVAVLAMQPRLLFTVDATGQELRTYRKRRGFAPVLISVVRREDIAELRLAQRMGLSNVTAVLRDGSSVNITAGVTASGTREQERLSQVLGEALERPWLDARGERHGTPLLPKTL